MSAALYVVLERRDPAVDTHMNGKALSRAEGELEGLAHVLGVIPLMEFFSMSPDDVLAETDALDVEVTDEPPLPEAWFPASEGLASARALLLYVTEHPASVPSASAVALDLHELVQVLEAAERHEIRWHLAVDY
jgi:hypothetical protein